MEASLDIQKYFKKINDEVIQVYDIAQKAKSKGYDPDDEVTVPLAKNMAERVEGLISTVAPEIIGKGIVKRIQELEKKYGSQDWRIALIIAEEVAKEKFCKFESQKKAIEVGIRFGFAYVTVGVVASPLEGFVNLNFKKRKDNDKEYFCLMYSGPIRSAGGTAGSISVLIADYVRKKMGYAEYDATEKEIKRAYTELTDYHERVTNLQYFPSQEEIIFLMKNLPIQISGDASEKYEVSNYKDLDRIESNRIRNGFCLVMAECLSLKAPKLWKQLSKWADDFDMGQWDFLKEFIDLQKQVKAKGSGNKKIKDEKDINIKPDYTYLKDVVAGRPVLAYPLRKGGFRLRYGRARTSGFSSDAIHPATMIALDNFMAIGSQMKSERPGKSTIFSSCDALDGPIVKLKDGSVMRFDDMVSAKNYNKEVVEILYLGDLLINYGDFLDRAHKLIPPGFVQEWWSLYIERYIEENNIDVEKLSSKLNLDVKKILDKPIKTEINFDDSLKISKNLNIPMHPRWIYFWNSIEKEDFLNLYSSLKKAVFENNKLIIFGLGEKQKRSLELIGIEHQLVGKEYIIIKGDDAKALIFNLGEFKKKPKGNNVLEMINSISEILIKDKLGHFIGGRMGRPEKAKMRKLNGSPHTLFPIGKEGGRLRCFQSALERGVVNAEFPLYRCNKCDNNTIFRTCEACGEKTKKLYFCRKCQEIKEEADCEKKDVKGVMHGPCLTYKRQKIDIKYYFEKCLEILGTQKYPNLIKGIRGTFNEGHMPEHPLKGILRAKNNIYVNKDGTTRYDMIEMVLTHFKPKEIGTPIEKLKIMGYNKDCYGNELKDENQILELKPQDIILPASIDSPNDGADKVLFNVTKFLDDLLVNLYGQKAYYNLEAKKDLVGHLCVAMSPHTSAGIVCRIAGFSNTQGFLAHPYLHSIMRRDCDGDEAAVMLLLDHLLNFSKKYLPNTRGATQDAPLVLTSKLIPAEVDDMVFNMDVAWKYNLNFYEAAEKWKMPWDVKVDVVGDRLGKENQYEKMGFTHDTDNFNNGVGCSAYKIIPSMQEKVLAQMKLAEKLRVVDENDVAKLIIERHFLRDIKGNLRKFSQQSFRCVKCNEIFRRPPLSGVCSFCGGKIIFTIAEGSVKKYLEPSIDLAKKYHLPKYLQQTLDILKVRIDSVFGVEPEIQEGLNKWFK
ncbi:MAG: DNA polymerase II large subunit [Nanoarchaeota archaeon]|nr:DNA polymerase II large subunit [Nanoarchaeota archaeon]